MPSPALDTRSDFSLECVGFRERPSQVLLPRLIEAIRAHPDLIESMRREPRWERFYSDPSAISFRDMNQFGHALNTYGIVQELSHPEVCPPDLSAEDVSALRIAALVHDFGELGVGDVTYDEKNDAAQQAEKSHFLLNLHHYLPGLSGAEHEAVQAIYLNITQSKDHENRRVQLFDLTERLGYVTTAVAVLRRQAAGVCFEELCANVLKNQGPKLIGHIEREASARSFVRRRLEGFESTLLMMRSSHVPDAQLIDFDVWQRITDLGKEEPAPSFHFTDPQHFRSWRPL